MMKLKIFVHRQMLFYIKYMKGLIVHVVYHQFTIHPGNIIIIETLLLFYYRLVNLSFCIVFK